MMLTLDLRPTERMLRQFGLIALAGFSLLGGLIYFWGGLPGLQLGNAARPVSIVLWAAGLASAAFSLAWPRANRPLYVALVLVAYPIGYAVSLLLMALVFYGVITPIGLVFRAMGRDPLDRHWERDAPSYWVAHQPPDTIDRYFRQF